MALIEVKHVTKHFGPKVALDDVSIDIPEGKIFGLLGPNGAGKSTLIRIINRITMATAGEVWFNGRPITDEDVAHIGYLPAERGLYRKAGYPSVIAPGLACTCPVRPDPDRTLATDFVLDFRTKGLFSAIWYFLRSAFRRFVIHNLSVYE